MFWVTFYKNGNLLGTWNCPDWDSLWYIVEGMPKEVTFEIN